MIDVFPIFLIRSSGNPGPSAEIYGPQPLAPRAGPGGSPQRAGDAGAPAAVHAALRDARMTDPHPDDTPEHLTPCDRHGRVYVNNVFQCPVSSVVQCRPGSGVFLGRPALPANANFRKIHLFCSQNSSRRQLGSACIFIAFAAGKAALHSLKIIQVNTQINKSINQRIRIQMRVQLAIFKLEVEIMLNDCDDQRTVVEAFPKDK